MRSRNSRDQRTLLFVIGVFDSGFGGLTILRGLLERMPQYDYLYLADSARAPYGSRSLEVVQRFTLEAVEWLFDQGCPLVVLACNTVSARALRHLQQNHLPIHRPDYRLLGVIRPSAEALADLPPGVRPGVTPPSDRTGTVAVLGTVGTVESGAYLDELEKLAPRLHVLQQACPLWVPLVEAGELDGPGTEWFLHRYIDPLFQRDDPPSRILLGCTHYPLLYDAIRRVVPSSCEVVSQADLVAERLEYWCRNHPEMERRLSRGGTRRFATTDNAEWFSQRGAMYLGQPCSAETILLPGVGTCNERC